MHVNTPPALTFKTGAFFGILRAVPFFHSLGNLLDSQDLRRSRSSIFGKVPRSDRQGRRFYSFWLSVRIYRPSGCLCPLRSKKICPLLDNSQIAEEPQIENDKEKDNFKLIFHSNMFALNYFSHQSGRFGNKFIYCLSRDILLAFSQSVQRVLIWTGTSITVV